jgi:hypothetical protein
MPGQVVSLTSGLRRGRQRHCRARAWRCAHWQRLRQDLSEQRFAQADLCHPPPPRVQPLSDHPMLLGMRVTASEPVLRIPAGVAGEGAELGEWALGLRSVH